MEVLSKGTTQNIYIYTHKHTHPHIYRELEYKIVNQIPTKLTMGIIPRAGGKDKWTKVIHTLEMSWGL